VWETRAEDFTRTILLRVFRDKGSYASAEITLGQSSSVNSPVAEALANGNFAVSWGDDIAGGIYHQVFDANGDAVSTRQFYNAAGTPVPRIAHLADGGYVLAWSEYDGTEADDSPETNVVLQRFDALGRVAGELLTIGGAGDDVLSDIETLKDGRIVVTYMSETGDATDVSNLRYQIIETRGAVIEGSAAADNMVAAMSDSTLYGYDGDDRLRGMGGDDALNGQGGADTLFGGTGDDTLSGGLGSDNVNGLQGDDMLRGGSGDDMLDGGVDADILSGDSGDDRLVGGGGRDVLNGGSGSDVFDFNAVAESGNSRATQDVISDFFDGEDTIDLSTIDARASVGGNQAFTFIGSAAFSAEGQIRVVVVGDTTVLQVNTAGTGGAEMVIRIAGVVTLDASDLVL
jgi:Ca2+-binding RTX toxin-like protein